MIDRRTTRGRELWLQVVSAALAVVALVATAEPTTALAAVGVGTNTGVIKLTEDVRTGGEYPIPTFQIGNTGSVGTAYVLSAIPHSAGRTPPESWVSFEPQTLYLFPGQWTGVKTKLDVPPDAVPGRYAAVLVATPRLPGAPEQARVGIGAGPRLEFTVVSGTVWESAAYRVRRWYLAGEPWSTAAVIVILAVALLLALRFVRRDDR